jgi:hypothetical protein
MIFHIATGAIMLPSAMPGKFSEVQRPQFLALTFGD